MVSMIILIEKGKRVFVVNMFLHITSIVDRLICIHTSSVVY